MAVAVQVASAVGVEAGVGVVGVGVVSVGVVGVGVVVRGRGA